MPCPNPSRRRRAPWAPIALALSVLAGCGSVPSKSTLDGVRVQQNPIDRSRRTITNFTPALRCMDELMFDAGTRDITMMMEEMRDATQKVPISTRDMMTSAISDMSRRSRAVRLSVFGSDQVNLAQVLQQAQRSQVFQVVPEYNLRGTISQFDEDVRRQSSSLGVLTERAFGVRFGSEAHFSVLGFDAALVRTDTFTLVPGATSKNTTVISKRDASAGDGQARLLGAGAVFSFDAARAEGTSQAARNMVELAAVELVGKLIRAPYWQCLGLPDSEPEVVREIDDWYLAMDASERIVFYKERMRERRWYDGALDAATGPDFDAAMAGYRAALGVPATGPLDREFFGRFVTQKVPRGPLAPLPKAAPAKPATTPPAPGAPAGATASASTAADGEGAAKKAPAPASEPTAPPVRVFSREVRSGEAEVQIVAATKGYLYCYAQDPSTQAIQRIFPNRFVRDPRVEAGALLALPGQAAFKIDPRQRIACIHAPREVYNDLPPPLRWGDFEDVRLTGFEQIRQAFAQTSSLPVALVAAQSVPR
jgi:curli biogenesis system outer membrane secretion channel CsgG